MPGTTRNLLSFTCKRCSYISFQGTYSRALEHLAGRNQPGSSRAGVSGCKRVINDFAQTGINQQDTSQQSPLLLYSTLIRTIHIKMTMSTLRTMRKTYQSHTLILKRILQTLPIQNIKPTMSRRLS